MSEKLNETENKEAKRFYRQAFIRAEILEGEKKNMRASKHVEDVLGDYYDENASYTAIITNDDPNLNPHSSTTRSKYTKTILPRWKAEGQVRHAEDSVDGNLWRAHQHKEEHLDEYIETARQEAEAQGVDIKLEPPKE